MPIKIHKLSYFCSTSNKSNVREITNSKTAF